MQLSYLYVTELNGILDQGFNFGGEFIFQYIALEKKLHVKANPFYIKGFFQEDPSSNSAEVLNVTGIVARNGSGKTSILNLILETFPSGAAGVGTPILFVIEKNGVYKVYGYEQFEIVFEGDITQSFETAQIVPEKKKVPSKVEGLEDIEIIFRTKLNEFGRTDFILFSNIFDGRYVGEVTGFYNMSTNFLLKNDLVSDILNKNISSQERHSEISTYIRRNISRQIKFINSFAAEKLVPFDLPETLVVRTLRDYHEFDYAFDTSDVQVFDDYGMTDVVRALFNLAGYQVTQQKDWKINAEIHFAKACIVNFIYEMSIDFKALKNFVQFDLSSIKFDPVFSFKDTVLTILDTIDQQIDGFNLGREDGLVPRLIGSREFVTKLGDFIDENLVGNADGTSFGIDIKKNPKDFAEFHKLYESTYSLKPFLEFGWRQMSSGEIAFLNIFSRFHDVALREQKFHRGERPKDLIILIDEGDAFLHPAWQKKFLKMLLDFLPKLFYNRDGSDRTMQIVMTTNSPIPVSDLPNSNVVFLERDETDKIKVKNSLEDKKKTFGANINTLFADTFFMHDGLIGDFAKSRINHVIELLHGSPKEIKENRGYLERTINMIGEPLVKNKLIQMLSDRLTLNLIGINDRIDLLERELEQLKKTR